MLHDRFDFALLSFFSYAQLAEPFTVHHVFHDEWEVTQHQKLIGRITAIGGVGFKEEKVA